MLSLDGRGRDGGVGCVLCASGVALYRCCDCMSYRMLCRDCIATRHLNEPLHMVEVSNTNFDLRYGCQINSLADRFGRDPIFSECRLVILVHATSSDIVSTRTAPCRSQRTESLSSYTTMDFTAYLSISVAVRRARNHIGSFWIMHGFLPHLSSPRRAQPFAFYDSSIHSISKRKPRPSTFTRSLPCSQMRRAFLIYRYDRIFSYRES
jgi:hypothetical protein